MEIAKYFNSHIISADSRQIYKYLNIGTSKPSLNEQKEVQHHLIDLIYPSEKYDAGKFIVDAAHIIEKLHQENIIPLVVGGTGFYIKMLLEGLFTSPNISPKTKEFVSRQENLYQLLQEKDPIVAAKIHANDLNKIKRFLEVYYETGKPISLHWQEQKKQPPKYKIFNIQIVKDREKLYQDINKRMDLMIKNGLLEEIKEILIEYSWDDFGLNTLGYKQFENYFSGSDSLSNCLEKAKRETRRYAKRQLTWYRNITFNLTLKTNYFSLKDVIKQIKNFFIL